MAQTDRLTHVNEVGEAHMVDVGEKDVTARTAIASGAITMKPETLALIREDGLKKGDALGVARVAGIMAAKQTAQLIPLCHPLPLTAVSVEFKLIDGLEMGRIEVMARTETVARTGIEMEALTAASVACLTLYDMAKAVDRTMSIDAIRLEYKNGGRSGEFRRNHGTGSID